MRPRSPHHHRQHHQHPSLLSSGAHNGPRRRRAPGPRTVLGGGPRSLLIMMATLASMLLLAFLQGTSLLRSHYEKRLEDSAGAIRGREDYERSIDSALNTLRTGKARGSGHGICPLLPSRSSAADLWGQYVASVLAASKHSDDPGYSHESWTKSLLFEVAPSSLRKTYASPDLPSPTSLNRVLRVIRDRINNPKSNPPLRVAVMGGSIAEGQNCDLASVEPPNGSIMANPTFCAWPYRFQTFVNSLFGKEPDGKDLEVVEIISMAEGGTDTAFMTPLVQNWIYPKEFLPGGPDVIVNGYGSADYAQYDGNAGILENVVRGEMDAFVAAVDSSTGCTEPPLIVHMDDSLVGDVIGPGKVLSARHGGVTRKVLQSERSTGKIPAEAQFGMAGHMAMGWVLAYNMLEAVLQYCHNFPSEKAESKAMAALGTEKCTGNEEGKPDQHPCTFSWFAGPTGTVTRVSEIANYIQPHVVHNVDWQALSDMSTGFSRKAGLVAVAPNAKIVFHFPKIKKEIRRFNLMTLKSNDPKWRNGKALFGLSVNPNVEGTEGKMTSFEIDGGHESPVHITYHFEVDLREENKAIVGSDVTLAIDLVGGSSFKILGLMLCA